MTDALLAAPQHVDAGILASIRAPSRTRCAELMPYDQTAYVCDRVRGGAGQLVPTAMSSTSGDSTAPIFGPVSATQRALADFTRSSQRAQKHQRLLQEKKWLAENRQKYSGRWIALEGDRLLAVGATSKEVFSRVAARAQPPLVIWIDAEDLPFAGW